MRVAFYLLVAASSVLAARPAAAQQCLLPWSWSSHSQIDVWIHPDLPANLKHDDGTTWTFDELRNEVEYSLGTLQENLPTGAPPFNVKTTASTYEWNERIPNAVHLVPDLYSCPGGGTCGCTATAYIPDQDVSPNAASDGIRVYLKRSSTGFKGGVNQNLHDCQKEYEHFETSSAPHTLRGIINHEFIHVLGVFHYDDVDCPFDCTAEPCSCVGNTDATTLQSTNCYLWEWQKLQAKYGDYSMSGTNRHRESSSGTSWSQLGTFPVNGSSPYFAVSSTYNSAPYMFAAFKYAPSLLPVAYRWVHSTQAWEYWGFPAFVQLVGKMGASYDFQSPGIYGYLAWLQGETTSNVRKQIRLDRYSSAWTATTATYTPLYLRFQELSVAHDPRYNVEVIALRDDVGTVYLQTYNASTNSFSSLHNTGGKSLDTPAVACGPTSITRNCIVVWADAAEAATTHYHTFRWKHFRLTSSTQVEFGVLKSHGYYLYGPPSVAYKGPTTSACAFMVSWKNPGTTYYTACKTTSESAGLTNQTSHSVGSGRWVNSPQIGSAFEHAEQLNTWLE